jgi:hypothetical protein
MVRWAIMVCSQRVTDDVPKGSGVGLGHLLRAVERCWGMAHGAGGQREPLKEVAIKREEVLLDERLTGDERVIQGELQQGPDLIEAIGGQAVAVGHQDHKDVPQPLMVRETGPKAIAYEARLEEGKAAGDLADALGA